MKSKILIIMMVVLSMLVVSVVAVEPPQPGKVYTRNGENVFIKSVSSSMIEFQKCKNPACTNVGHSIYEDVSYSNTYKTTSVNPPASPPSDNPTSEGGCIASSPTCVNIFDGSKTPNPDYNPEPACDSNSEQCLGWKDGAYYPYNNPAYVKPATTSRPATRPRTRRARTATTPPTVQELLTKANGQDTAGNTQEAIKIMESILTRSDLTPQQLVKTKLELGTLYNKAGNYQKALDLYNEVLNVQSLSEENKALAESRRQTTLNAQRVPRGTARSGPEEGFVEVANGKKLPRSRLLERIRKDTIPDGLVSAECKADLNKCKDSEFGKLLTHADVKLTDNLRYDARTHSLRNENFAVKFSDDGKYGVNSAGEIREFSQAVGKGGNLIGKLPEGQSFNTVTSIQKDLIEFRDGSARLGSATIPARVHQEFKGQYDMDKISEVTSTGNSIAFTLKSGGTVGVETHENGISTTTVIPKPGETPEVTHLTPDGTKYDDDWKLDEQGNLEQGNEKIIVTKDADGNWMVETADTSTGRAITVKIVQKTPDGIRTTNLKDGRPTDIVVKDAQGRIIGQLEEIDENGDVKKFEWYDQDGNIRAICRNSDCVDSRASGIMTFTTDKTVCVGTKAHCSNTANHINEDDLDDDEACAKNSACLALKNSGQLEQAREDKDSADVTRGWNSFKKGFGATMDYWNKIRGVTPSGLRSVSSWIAPELTKDMNRFASKTFDKVMLADYVVPALMCDYDQAQKTQSPGSSSTFIEVAPGTVQFTGSIQAEKTPQASPMLCGEELECSVGECINEVCMDGEEILFGTFYKVTWAVSAPQDEKHTPYLDENGVAVSYNIQIQGEKNQWLYPGDLPGNEYTLKLDNSASDRDVFATYSTKEYNRVCIIFGQPPTDIAGTPVNEICADFIESTQGQIDYDGGSSGSSGGSGGGGTAKAADAGRKQI